MSFDPSRVMGGLVGGIFAPFKKLLGCLGILFALSVLPLLGMLWLDANVPGWLSTLLVVGLFFSVAFVVAIRIHVGGRGRTAHGTARWGDPQRLIAGAGFPLGTLRDQRRAILRDASDVHILTIGRTGGGKSSGAAIP